jgi:hypothetical protein
MVLKLPKLATITPLKRSLKKSRTKSEPTSNRVARDAVTGPSEFGAIGRPHTATKKVNTRKSLPPIQVCERREARHHAEAGNHSLHETEKHALLTGVAVPTTELQVKEPAHGSANAVAGTERHTALMTASTNKQGDDPDAAPEVNQPVAAAASAETEGGSGTTTLNLETNATSLDNPADTARVILIEPVTSAANISKQGDDPDAAPEVNRAVAAAASAETEGGSGTTTLNLETNATSLDNPAATAQVSVLAPVNAANTRKQGGDNPRDDPDAVPEHHQQKRNEAAITIQAAFRGSQSRKSTKQQVAAAEDVIRMVSTSAALESLVEVSVKLKRNSANESFGFGFGSKGRSAKAVTNVTTESPADGNFRVGDVLVQINGIDVTLLDHDTVVKLVTSTNELAATVKRVRELARTVDQPPGAGEARVGLQSTDGPTARATNSTLEVDGATVVVALSGLILPAVRGDLVDAEGAIVGSEATVGADEAIVA